MIPLLARRRRLVGRTWHIVDSTASAGKHLAKAIDRYDRCDRQTPYDRQKGIANRCRQRPLKWIGGGDGKRFPMISESLWGRREADR